LLNRYPYIDGVRRHRLLSGTGDSTLLNAGVRFVDDFLLPDFLLWCRFGVLPLVNACTRCSLDESLGLFLMLPLCPRRPLVWSSPKS
jgi:hypothetical protein